MFGSLLRVIVRKHFRTSSKSETLFDETKMHVKTKLGLAIGKI